MIIIQIIDHCHLFISRLLNECMTPSPPSVSPTLPAAQHSGRPHKATSRKCQPHPPGAQPGPPQSFQQPTPANSRPAAPPTGQRATTRAPPGRRRTAQRASRRPPPRAAGSSRSGRPPHATQPAPVLRRNPGHQPRRQLHAASRMPRRQTTAMA